MTGIGDEMLTSLLQEAEANKFEPFADYNPDGDCLEFYLSNAPSYAKVLDGWVTLYLSEESDELVGGLIKGVQHNLLRRFPGVDIDIEDRNHARVAILLRPPSYEAKDGKVMKVYRELIERVESTGLVADLQPG